MQTILRIISLLAFALIGLDDLAAQSALPASTNPITQFGDALPGLTSAQRSDFAAGLGEFQTVETVADGLGPIYNNVSCVACHSTPAPGGGSTTLETRFGRLENGIFDPLAEQGGSLLQQFAIDPTAQEVIPADANVIAKRITTPLFGAGLIEAIPDAVIVFNARIPKPDEITGRLSHVTDVATVRSGSAVSAGRHNRRHCLRSRATHI